MRSYTETDPHHQMVPNPKSIDIELFVKYKIIRIVGHATAD